MIGLNVEWKDLEKWLKISVTGMILITPIFYFDIFLFKHEFITGNSVYMNVIIAYVLSISSFLQNSITGWLILNEDNANPEKAFTYGIIFSLLLLLPLTFIGWFFHWTFVSFLFAVFIAPMSFWLVNFIVGMFRSAQNIKMP